MPTCLCPRVRARLRRIAGPHDDASQRSLESRGDGAARGRAALAGHAEQQQPTIVARDDGAPHTHVRERATPGPSSHSRRDAAHVAHGARAKHTQHECNVHDGARQTREVHLSAR